MKISIASAIALLAISTLSCNHSQEVVNPAANARQGSSGGGGTTPTPTPTGALPVLTPNPTPINNLGPIMPTGTWTVKSYYRAFSDKTTDYTGYKLVFSPNGTVVATDDQGASYSGGWYATIGGQVAYYGGAISITALTMNFGKSAPSKLSRFNATWNVNMATTTTDVVLDNFEPLSGERVEFSL
ncbi:hypothetical protein J2I47_10965 [Fibrella sp. HMF5335]|uniref:Lipocalin-like domain-containing protein n=1 Tax=Fibrella rubiginis TaxID=2817060 RepID=A0A939GEW5_9BACT|nr:hypothetical protein [Fibrella rubiginis]MBO0937066.1 hypothetical protein [Fibrella rubiginis]